MGEKVCVMLFKMWKYVLKLSYQTGPQSPLIWMRFVTFVPFCAWKMLAQLLFFVFKKSVTRKFLPFIHIPMFLWTRWSSISKSNSRYANEINVKFVVLKQKFLFLPINDIDKWQTLFFGGYGIVLSFKKFQRFLHIPMFLWAHIYPISKSNTRCANEISVKFGVLNKIVYFSL